CLMKPLLSIFLLLLSASAFSAGGRPRVYLSHFYIALDQATYDALLKSPDIAALAGTEERRTVAGPSNWSGFYVYGRQTYMEFFAADTLPEGESKQDCGLGLAVEKAGGVNAVATQLRPVFGDKAKIDKQVRTISNGDIPWYSAAAVDANDPGAMVTWVMEVDSSYLAAMHPGSFVKHPLSREQYLSWNFLPDRLLDAVVGIRAALNSVEMTQLANELELIGWSVHREGGGFLAKGPDASLEVVPGGSRMGIQRVALRLRRSVPKRVIELGSAKLVLDGKSGKLIFWGPE
ncbi:MAG TPA: DUF5829 family protein, partial [Steroidobacteraceae bacterium]